MFKAVVFDLDNTLCNTSKAIQFSLTETFKLKNSYFQVKNLDEFLIINQRAFQEIYFNLSIPSISKPILIWLKMFELMEMKPSLKELLEIISIYKNNMLNALTLYYGVEDLFRKLYKEKVKIGILSNGIFIDQAEKIIKLGLSSYINTLITPDISLSYKPELKSYRYILKQLEVEPHQTIMVGNSLFDDLQGAKKIGMFTLLIKGPHYKEKLDKTIIDYIVNNPSEIFNQLNL